MFTLRRGTWSQAAQLTALSEADDGFYGWSVALSARGTTALIGVPNQTVGTSAGAGAAFVFTLRRGTWSQAAELTDPDAAWDDQFGFAVALSRLGATALIGASGHTVGTSQQAGQPTCTPHSAAPSGAVSTGASEDRLPRSPRSAHRGPSGREGRCPPADRSAAG